MIKGPAYRQGGVLRGYTDISFFGTSKNHRMDFFSGTKAAFPFRDIDGHFRIASQESNPPNTVCCIGGECVEGLTPQQCVAQGGYTLTGDDCSQVACLSCCQLGHPEKYTNIQITGLGGTVSAVNMPCGLIDHGNGFSEIVCGSCTYDLAELNQTISACACGNGREYPKVEEGNACPVPGIPNGFFGRKPNRGSWISYVVPNTNPNKQPGDPECFLLVQGYLGFMGWNGTQGLGNWGIQISAYGVGYYGDVIEVWPDIPRGDNTILQNCLPADPGSPSGGAVTGTHSCLIFSDNGCGGQGILAFNGLTKGSAIVSWTDTPLNPDLQLEEGCL